LPLLSLACLVLLSLFSFHPNDPTLFSKGSVGSSYNNWCGFIGANFAGLPIAFVGLGSWLLPPYIAWEAFSHEPRQSHRRVAWLVFALTVWTALGAFGAIAWPPNYATAETIQCGGWVGYVLWPRLRTFFGPVGLPITLLVLGLLSFSVMAPKLANSVVQKILDWLENSAWPWLKPWCHKLYHSVKGLFEKLFSSFGKHNQKTMEELNSTDGVELTQMAENDQAVGSLERAEKENNAIAQFIAKQDAKFSPRMSDSDAELSSIESMKLNGNEIQSDGSLPLIYSIAVGETPPNMADYSGVHAASAGQGTRPQPDKNPSALLKAQPQAPARRPSTAEPKRMHNSSVHIVKQHSLGLSDPTPNPNLNGARSQSNEQPSNIQPLRPDLPPKTLFDPMGSRVRLDPFQLEETKALIQQKLTEFKVKGRISGMQPGPVVTVYEFSPDAGVPLAKVLSMEEDLALGLKAEKVRIDRVHGKNVVGIEVPNSGRETISFREIIDSPEFLEITQKGGNNLLSMALGKDIGGKPVVADLSKMPHLLIGGSTGSGKSVGVNAMICSILLSARAEEAKFILVDPKMVELGVYEDIPHLWAPVVTDMKEAGRVLKWVVAQMEDRYRRLTVLSVRNLEQFNEKVIEAGGSVDLSNKTPNPKWPDRPDKLEPLPYVVVVIDELADLMMVCRSEVEDSIARIAQKARAVGIHLVLATQRPSVDIVTGVIKANLPARLSYRVNTKIDSRTILDSGGGEQLLGKGDALFLAPGTARPRRIHAPLLTEDEILRLVEWLKERGRPDYNQALIKAMDTEDDGASPMAGEQGGDDIYAKAVALVLRERKASTSLLQRKLSIGYGRAAKIIDRMEDEGLVGPDRGSGKPREVLADAE
jgi:S-DNA-T family DNA segregation ATPase FtsK/SpoIIIE